MLTFCVHKCFLFGLLLCKFIVKQVLGSCAAQNQTQNKSSQTYRALEWSFAAYRNFPVSVVICRQNYTQNIWIAESTGFGHANCLFMRLMRCCLFSSFSSIPNFSHTCLFCMLQLLSDMVMAMNWLELWLHHYKQHTQFSGCVHPIRQPTNISMLLLKCCLCCHNHSQNNSSEPM